MMKNRMHVLFVICLLTMANVLSAQTMRTEDEIIQYLDNATNLDLIEGIYFDRASSRWRAVVYNKNTMVFDCYDIESKNRTLLPFGYLTNKMLKYETHLVRAVKYAYVYYAYIVVDGKKVESGCSYTFDSENTYGHWNCGKVPSCNKDYPYYHIWLNLKEKVYPN